MTHDFMQHLKHRTRIVRHAALLVGASTMLAGCGLFDTDVANVNAVTEEALADAAAATSMVNGLSGTLHFAVNGLVGVSGTASDELQWAGSREYWNLLDGGDIGDPVNEYSNGTYPYISQARWQGDYTVAKLEEFDKTTPSSLRNRSDLARAYILAGTAYLFIGENYEDFIIASDRTESAASVGEANMLITIDSAIKYYDKALALATTLSNNELRSQALGLRARAKFSRVVWTKLRAPRGFPANPLVNDAGANADATAALALMGSSYRYRSTSTAQNATGYFNTGFEMNQRLELRAGAPYVNGTATVVTAGIAGIKLNDPVSGQPDATLAIAINECCRQSSTQFIGYTLTSAREMYLILAEAALASGNTAAFTTNINAARAIDGKPAWSNTPSAQDILIHERRVGLFLQGRRLHDHYRFNQPADRWLAIRAATKRPCFLPISFDERTQNKLAPQPAQDRPTACQ
ncbi:MAG TPA: RagB/SusD family nutrient uptake outer membrane protein [Gemmatimonadaceae bacterium]|nr:RagB/SusD family nutrient uptake outer membrane protein [Gemmatimonadaceae bacterium]